MEIKIYTYGRYDKSAMIKQKARILLNKKRSALAQSVDYFFKEFGR